MSIEITTVAERPSATGPKIVEVPEEVAAELEQLFSHLVENPGQLPLIKADTPEELRTWLAQAKAWGETRDAGILEVRKSPRRGLPDNEAVVRIRPPLSDEEKARNKAANEKRKAKADA